MNLDRITDISHKLVKKININNNDLLNKFPVNNYLKLLNNYPQTIYYHYVSAEIKEYCNNIVKLGGEDLLGLYHQLILIELILNAPDKLKLLNLPEDIKVLYNKNFKRIVEKIESEPGNCFTYLYDSFCKDLAVCSLRMIPVGARKIHLSSISRGFLFRKGLPQFVKRGLFVLFELGGLSPLFGMHTDSNDNDLMAEFNHEGFVRTCIRIAELLKANENVKGLFGSSWFYDPQLEVISPRLAYLSQIITKNGGKSFYAGQSEQATQDAILKSPTRRRLYKEGKYIPTIYMVVWPRKKLINWANKLI